MSATATATIVANDAPPPKAGKKKLLLIVGVAVLALVLIGGVAFWLMKSRAAAAEDDADGAPAAHAVAKHDDAAKTPPVYLPLEPFTVNLADRDGERFAQIAVTLEIDDAHFGDQLKLYLPAIRHNVLMTLAQKTAAELLTREGKELLARQIQRDVLRPLGIEVADPAAAAADAEHDDEAPAKKKGKRKKAAAPAYPVRSVQFASFIIQ